MPFRSRSRTLAHPSIHPSVASRASRSGLARGLSAPRAIRSVVGRRHGRQSRGWHDAHEWHGRAGDDGAAQVYSVEVRQLVKMMLQTAPMKRPSVDEMLHMPFIRKRLTHLLERCVACRML
jgi:hypothetical protein